MTPVFNSDSKLRDIIFYDVSVIPVLDRFGIRLGVGDITVGEYCQDKDIDLDFLLAVINVFLDKDFIPANPVRVTRLEQVAEYLEKTDLYYRNISLPNIERHFNILISKSQQNKRGDNLDMLKKFFSNLRDDFCKFIDTDINLWIPLFRRSAGIPGKYIGIENENDLLDKFNEDKREAFSIGGNIIEDQLRDLLSFFVVYLKGEYDNNLMVAVVSSLFVLEKDVTQNNRVRDRILKPLLKGI